MNERLRNRRNELNLTQAQLAEIVGVDRSMISKLESGARCSISVGLRIAKALGTTLEELFGTDETSTHGAIGQKCMSNHKPEGRCTT